MLEPVNAPEAPEDLYFQPLELDESDSVGAITRGEERAMNARRNTVDLPPLNLSPKAGVIPDKEPRGAPIYIAAAVVSCLWALAPIMFAIGYRRGVAPFESDLFAFSVLALMAVGPIALVWIAAFMLHQGARLAAQARRTTALADNLVQPTAMAARGVGSAVESVRQEIEQATAATIHARGELLTLRDLLAEESERLVAAAAGSRRDATDLTHELGAEREKMHQLTDLLGAQAAGVVDAIGRHARMVAEASDLAETQIREAEATLAARAADLAAAAGEANDAARVAGEDLSRQVARLETASLGVGDQVRVLEEGLTEQRAALVATAHGMRADHEAFSTEAESQMAQLAEILTHARGGATELNDAATHTSEAMRQLIEETTEKLRVMAESAAEQRELTGAAAAQSLGAVAEIAHRQREAIEDQTRQTMEALSNAAAESRRAALLAAEEAQQAADERSQAARDQLDQLGEAAFTAGQRADAAFEARLSQARGMIEQSAQMVEEAGVRSTTRLNEGVGAARATLTDLERLLADIDSRVGGLPQAALVQAAAVRESVERSINDLMESARRATDAVDARVAGLPQAAQAQAEAVRESVERSIDDLMESTRRATDAIDARMAGLPQAAQVQAEAVRASVERSIDDLMASARRAAEETQAIDATFQDRIRRNYDMLSEAVRLMGVVAGAAGSAPRAAPPRPVTTPAPTPANAPPVSEPRPPAPAAEGSPTAEPPSDARPRLKLTPTASDEEFRTVFGTAGGREAPEPASSPQPSPSQGDSWTWKELLSSMDDGMDEALGDDKSLADNLIAEISVMGIDAGALLPRPRIDQIAAAIQAGEPGAGREIVRRLAPAAVRRLGRRMMSDRVFRGQADRYVTRYEAMIAENSGDGQSFVAAALLGSDQGRAFLLFDAAINDGR